MVRMMHLFRKYQYMLLVVFGVLLMFVFVAGDAAMKMVGGPGSSRGRDIEDDVILTWKHGVVRSSDLYSMASQHRVVVEYLDNIIQTALQRQAFPRAPGLRFNQFTRQVEDPGIPRSSQDDAIIETMLLAAKAESMGIAVDNEAIFDFLDQLGGGEISRDELGNIFQSTIATRMSEDHLMDALRRELLAQQARMMSASGMFVMRPSEAWEYHTRLNRRVKAELLPLAVADFKDKVEGEPTDGEIQAMFEEAKERYPNPALPEPGFRQMRKRAFQYVKADFTKYLEEEVAKVEGDVTDADVEEYYEKNKQTRYRELDLPSGTPDGDSETETPAEGEGSPADAESGEAESESEPKQSEEATPSEEDADAPPAPPADDQPEDSEDEPDAANDNSDESEAPSSDAPEASDDSDGCQDEQAEPTEPASDDESPDAEPPAPESPAEPAEEDAAEPTEKKADETPDAADKDDPAEPPAATEDQPAAEATEDATSADAEGAAPEQEEEVKYKPLDDELRAEIRKQIAEDRARTDAQSRHDAALSAIQRKIERFATDMTKWEELHELKPDMTKPAPVDVQTLVTDAGLEYAETPLLDPLAIRDLELGKQEMMQFGGGQPITITFAQIGYADQVSLWQPQRIRGEDFNVSYMFWATENEEPYVPGLAEARDQVIDAWKTQQARTLAREEAERLAAEAADKESLKDLLVEGDTRQVTETNQFTWMSMGLAAMGMGMPDLGSVDGTENIGHDFMEAVFALKAGETGVAANHPQDTVYVVRLVSDTPGEDELRKQFVDGGFSREIQMLAAGDTVELRASWFKDLERELNVVRR